MSSKIATIFLDCCSAAGIVMLSQIYKDTNESPQLGFFWIRILTMSLGIGAADILAPLSAFRSFLSCESMYWALRCARGAEAIVTNPAQDARMKSQYHSSPVNPPPSIRLAVIRRQSIFVIQLLPPILDHFIHSRNFSGIVFDTVYPLSSHPQPSPNPDQRSLFRQFTTL